ncbi:hypothetical protein SA9_12350, partial [Staphylococcus warneri]
MHGRGQGCLPATAGRRHACPGGALQPLSRQCQGDDDADNRKLERWYGNGGRRPPCAGDPGYQRDQFCHQGTKPAWLGRDRSWQHPRGVAAPDAGRRRGKRLLPWPVARRDLDPPGPPHRLA